MKSFWIGSIAAVILAVVAGTILTASETPKLRSLLTQIAHLIPGRPNDEEQLAVQQLR